LGQMVKLTTLKARLVGKDTNIYIVLIMLIHSRVAKMTIVRLFFTMALFSIGLSMSWISIMPFFMKT